MSTSDHSWGSDSEEPEAALPTIRREAAPARRVMAPVEEPEDDDGDVDLWVSDEPTALLAAEQALSDAELLSTTQQVVASIDDLPDPNALFEQMQGRGVPVEVEDLPDPDALFLQMQAQGATVEVEDLPDPNALFLQMQAQASAVEEDLPDPNALFLQMQAQASAVEEDLPDPNALFLRMQAQGAAAEEELPDPQALFLRMQALGETAEEDLPDPNALFLQMQAQRTAEDDDLPDPNALFQQMQLQRVAENDPSEPSIPLLKLRSRTADEDLLNLAPLEPAPPDSNDLFLQMQSRSEGGPMVEASGADALFLKLRAETGDPDSLPNPDTLFLQMQAQVAPAFEQPLGDDLPDPNALFLQMQAREAVVLPQGGGDDLPDPNALFLQMQAHLPPETPVLPKFVETDNEWIPPLPEPQVASPRLRDEVKAEEKLEEKLEEKGSLFSRIKAKFTRDKKVDLESPPPVSGSAGVGAALPDPAELFRRMQDEEEALLLEGHDSEEVAPLPSPNELFRRLKSGELEHPVAETPEGLPALPDLDAFRAELEAEERARLDADLLDDLSGPERFADTVSDLVFSSGTFFTAPVEKSAVHKPPQQRQDKFLPPPRPFGVDSDEPVPAMLAKPDATPKPSPPARTRPPEASPEPARPVYQAAPKPVKRKSASTALMPKEGDPAVAARARANLSDRLARFRARRKSISRQGLSIFTRQMAAMLKAGISVHQSISFCAEADPESAPVLEDICGKIESGFSLSGALKDYPESFDAVYIGLVHAGELSGRMNEMLAKLADILERELDLRKRMISVVTYPAILLAVSMLGTLGFIFFVLPQLTPLFMDLKVDLPWPTKVLLGLREVLLPLAVLATAAVIALLAMKGTIVAYVKSRPTLERRLAYVPLSLPVLGKVYDKLITARVLYSLATMLEVGVTMSQALARAEGTSGNAYVGYRLMRARLDLTDGASVTECFQVNQVFPETALQLIAAGEESARLVDMFTYVARHFDEEVEQSMNAAAGLLEPLIMVVMGLIVGFITIAAAMPTIKLLDGF